MEVSSRRRFFVKKCVRSGSVCSERLGAGVGRGQIQMFRKGRRIESLVIQNGVCWSVWRPELADARFTGFGQDLGLNVFTFRMVSVRSVWRLQLAEARFI